MLEVMGWRKFMKITFSLTSESLNLKKKKKSLKVEEFVSPLLIN